MDNAAAHLVQPLNWYYTSQRPCWLQDLHISLWTQVQLLIEPGEGIAKLMHYTQIQGSAKYHGIHGQESNKTVCLFSTSDPQFSQSQTIAEAQRACSLSFGIDSIVALARGTQCGLGLAPFAGVAGFFALFFFSDVPKVRNDIWVYQLLENTSGKKFLLRTTYVSTLIYICFGYLESFGGVMATDSTEFGSCTYPARISPASICVMRAIHLRPAPMSFFHPI
ncbi:hypothetical protein CJF30_00003881 [Rutstroemia sp. NJR-2017a BBW]|nr:hypothetical protein CJF30_00003881 [Rutstroemia sp. NJR-2017a BBW]